jgi:hypothetical protein
MLDATRKAGRKLVRVLVVEPDDCWQGIPWDRIRHEMVKAGESGHRYQSIDVPKLGKYYGVPLVQYIKPKKNLAQIKMGIE